MAKAVQLPDGSYFPVNEGEDYATAMQAAYAKYPEAFGRQKEGPKPETGLLADVKSSARNLLNIGRTGLGALTGDTTAAAMEGAQRQEEAAKAYTPGFQPQKIADKFNSGEYFGAAGEAVSQVPSAIAGLLPSVGQEIGSAALGRLAGGAAGALLPIPGGAALGATVGQYAVPLIVNAIQALGSQAQEKVQTQIEAGEKPDVNALELAPYAAANAAANLVGTKIAMPGIFKKAIGQRVAEESGDAARAALMAEATKTAGRGTMAAIGYGTGRFAIGELPTEIFQDVIDRAAIGKPLADDEAITQYRNTALNMALASPLGGGFALKERSNARDVTAQQKIKTDAEANLAQKAQQDAAAAQLELDKQTPEYQADLKTRYETALQQWNALKGAAKNPGNTAEPAEKEAYKLAKTEFDTFNKEVMGPLAQEYAPYLKEDQAARAALAAQTPAPVILPPQIGGQADLFAAAPTAKQAAKQNAKQAAQLAPLPFDLDDTATPLARYAEINAYLQRQIEEAQTRFSEAPDANAAEQHIAQYNKFKQAQDQLVAARPQIEARNAQLPLQQRENIEPAMAPEVQTAKLQALNTALQKAQQLGDVEKGAKLIEQIKPLQAQPALFGETDLVPLSAPPSLATQIQQGQAAAQRAREKVAAELAAISSIAKKGAQPSAAAQIKTQMDAAAARTLLNALDKVKIVDKKGTLTVQHDQDWKRLEKNPTDTAYQEDRFRLKDGLETEIRRLEKLNKQDTLVRSPADVARVGMELAAKQAALVEVNKRIEIGDRGVKNAQGVFVSSGTTAPSSTEDPQGLPGNLRQAQAAFKAPAPRALAEVEETDAGSAIGVGGTEYKGNLDLSNERVADLVDRLFLTGYDTKTAGQELAGQPKATPLDIAGNAQAAEFINRAVPPATSKETSQQGAGSALRTTAPETDVQRATARELLGQFANKKTETLPILDAQDELDRFRDNTRLLTELNEDIQKAGAPTNAAKVDALLVLKNQRTFVEREISRARDKYNLLVSREQATPEAEPAAPVADELLKPLEKQRKIAAGIQKQLDVAYAERDAQLAKISETPQLADLLAKFAPAKTNKKVIDIEKAEQELKAVTGKVSEQYNKFAQAREAERTQEAPQEGQTDLFGMDDLLQEVTTQQVSAALTAVVNSQIRIEGLRKALSKTDGDAGQYLREQAVKIEDKAASVAAQLQRYITLSSAVKQKETELAQAKKDTQTARKQATPEQLAQAETGLTDAIAARDKQQELVNRLKDVVKKNTLPTAGGEFYKTAVSGAEGLQAAANLEPAQRRLNELNVVVNNATQSLDGLKRLAPEETQERKTANQTNIAKLETQLENARKDLAESELDSSVSKEQAQLREDAAWFTRTANIGSAIRKTGKQGPVQQLEGLLEKELSRNEKLKAEADALKTAQQSYYQQADVLRNAAPGQRLAEELQGGRGYRDVTGAPRKGPKHKESWGMSDIPKTAITPVNKVAQASVALSRAQVLVSTVTKEAQTASTADKLVAAHNEMAALLTSKAQLGFAERGTLNPDSFEAVAEEIRKLQALVKKWGTDALYKNAQTIRKAFASFKWQDTNLVLETKKRLETAVNNTETQIAPLDKKLQEYKASFINAVDEIGIASALNFVKPEALKVDAAHSKAVGMYAAARRDLLLFQLELSKKVQSAKKEIQQKIDALVQKQANSPDLQKLIAEKDEAFRVQKDALDQADTAKEKLAAVVAKQKADAQAAQTAKAAATAARNAPYAGVPGQTVAAAQQGLGLQGVRRVRSTASGVAKATQVNAKKLLGKATTELAQLEKTDLINKVRAQVSLAQQEVDKAARQKGDGAALKTANDNLVKITNTLDRAYKSIDAKAVRAKIKEIQKLEARLTQVYDLGTDTTTQVGPNADALGVLLTDEDVYTQEIAEGVRLPRPTKGPVVRDATPPPSEMLSGTKESRKSITKGNQPKQSGRVALEEADLSQESANALSLAFTKAQLDAATKNTPRRTELQAQYDQLTDGLSEAEIETRMETGKRLLGYGNSLELIAATERFREAVAAVTEADKRERAAKSNAAREIAQTELEDAEAESDRRERILDTVRGKLAAAELPIPSTRRSATSRLIATGKEESSQGAYSPEQEELAPSRIKAKATLDSSETERSTFGYTRSYARGVEGYSRDLSPTQIDLVANNELEGALTDIANDKGSDALNKAVARRLSLLLDDTSSTVQDTIVDSKGEEAIGMFYKKAVYLSRNGGLNQEALLHEGTHAGADRVLDMYDEDPSQLTDTQRAAIRELMAIHAMIKKDPGVTSVNAKKTLKEFVAEVLSNQRLQEQLKERSWRLSDMLRAFKSVILRAIGIDPKTVDNMLDASILAIDNIFTPSSQQVGNAATPSFAKTQSVFIGSSPDALTTFRGNFLGLAGRVQYIDAKAAREAAFAAAEKAGKLTNNELFQANYFMRMADKVSQAVGQFLSYGPISIVRDPKSGEYGYGRKAGATMVRVAELVEKSGVKDGEMMLTRIAAGQRADAVPNGWERLAGKKAAEAKVEYENAVASLQTNPTAKKYMDAALLEYKQFNGGLLDFAEQHDLLSAEEVARLKKTPFVPFYRIEDGVVKLYSDSETAIRIGDISNDKELVRMLGSEQTILPIFTSAVQNTYMLTRLSMHNKESLESSNALFKAGFVSKMGKGQGLASKDTVHYRLKGEPHFATIDSDTFGIPAELIVAGMSGIKTTIPILVRAMGYPADLVRKFVTRAPVYPFRQLVRDPINAAILSGVDGVPILNALKELGKMRMGTSTAEDALSGGLVVSSNVFSGSERDMQQFIESIATGKNWWKKTMGALDTFALQTDAATRATVYQDGLKKGLSEFRAQLNAAESQNFGRHGLSPSMHYLSTLIPFFNSQVQGLDLLYRALKGKLPFSEQLELKRKLYARGAMLTVGVMAYAAMMQDDEAYKKATPQERYSNLFMPLPGLKEPLKIPIPYEVGVLFVALPQMIIDLVFRDTKAREALKGMGGVLAQSVPGVVPAAAKPVLEAFYGSTTVGPIESEREKKIQAEYRFKDTTPEALRIAGSLTGMAGVSPIMLTHLVRGYTGGLGVALLQVFDPLLGASGTGEKASVPLNKQPLIGGLFQSAEGRGFIDAAYDHMERIQQARQTYVHMVERGQRAEAAAFAQRYANELAAAAVSGQTFKRLGDLYSMERKIRAHPTMTTAQKDNMLDKIKTEQNRIAVSFERLTDRTTRP